MKVILTQTVPKVGKEGQVVNVASGFARNFLFPKHLARSADKAGLARLEREKGKVMAEVEKTRGSAEQLSDRLKGATIRITGSTAKGSVKLFGAVTAADISEAIKKDLDIQLDKRSVVLLHPIKRLGKYDVMIDLHRDVDAIIHLEVANQDGLLGYAEPEKLTPAQPEPQSQEPSAQEMTGKRDETAETVETSAASS